MSIIDTTLGFPFVQQCRKNAMPQKSYSHCVRYNAPPICLEIDTHLNANKKKNEIMKLIVLTRDNLVAVFERNCPLLSETESLTKLSVLGLGLDNSIRY